MLSRFEEQTPEKLQSTFEQASSTASMIEEALDGGTGRTDNDLSCFSKQKTDSRVRMGGSIRKIVAQKVVKYKLGNPSIGVMPPTVDVTRDRETPGVSL
jgi:hypothetical protein